jgi:hypothetical protein
VTKEEMLMRALQCRALAKAETNLDAKLPYLDIAETWERLARQIEELGAPPDAVVAKAALERGTPVDGGGDK